MVVSLGAISAADQDGLRRQRGRAAAATRGGLPSRPARANGCQAGRHRRGAGEPGETESRSVTPATIPGAYPCSGLAGSEGQGLGGQGGAGEAVVIDVGGGAGLIGHAIELADHVLVGGGAGGQVEEAVVEAG